MKYIGVDYSTRKLAVVVLEYDRKPVVFSSTLGRIRYHDRLDAMLEVYKRFTGIMIDLNGTRADKAIAVEAPIMGMKRDVQTALWMGMTAGALVSAASEFTDTVCLVSPSTWKKTITGYGNAKKDGVEFWLVNKQPALAAACSNDDERDAACLALYARSIDEERTDDDQEDDEEASVGR